MECILYMCFIYHIVRPLSREIFFTIEIFRPRKGFCEEVRNGEWKRAKRNKSIGKRQRKNRMGLRQRIFNHSDQFFEIP
jgi:hypothetical protein